MNIKKISGDLNRICRTVNIQDNQEIIEKYSRDWRNRYHYLAMCVVFPKSSKEVSDVVNYCRINFISVIPQGGNTGLVGGTSPNEDNSTIIINLERMNNILKIDDLNNYIECESGVILHDLSNKVAKYNYHFPLSMASSGSCQIGGAISTNAGGINVIKYGSIRQNILDLEVVLSSGEIIHTGSKVIKDNTGYNLKDLFCGAEGTLGIITKATIKIFPKPTDFVDVFISYDSLDNLVDISQFLMKNFSGKIEALEIISKASFDICLKHKVIKKSFFSEEAEYFNLIRFSLMEDKRAFLDFFENEIIQKENSFKEILIAQNTKQSTEFWKFREELSDIQKKEGKLIAFDISVPIDKMNQFILNAKNDLNKICPQIIFNIFGHFGDSNIHFNLIEPNEFKGNFFSYEAKFKQIIIKLLISSGGSISAEHGIGLSKKNDLLSTKNKNEIQIMKNIKKSLDPKNILNPSKIFD